MKEGTYLAWHSQSVDDVLEGLSTTHRGLTESEAAERVKEYGLNELPSDPPRGWMSIFIAQFGSPLMIVLLFAAGTSMVLREWLDVGVIWAAILLNVILGFVEEYKADQSLQRLKRYLPQTVQVRRDGETKTVESKRIVPGDVLLLASGDKITADGRVMKVDAFEVSEAALTGESTPVTKQVDKVDVKTQITDQKSMVFAGTVVFSGRAEVVVTGTGKRTELGQISGLISDTDDEETALQKQLRVFVRFLAFAISVIAVGVFVVGIVRNQPPVEMFQVAVALAVASIPEGLAVAVTVIFAVGMQRILKRRALVRRLVSTETLGSVSIICVDKTGTLTEGAMAVDEVRIDGVKVERVDDTRLVGLKQYLLMANFAREEKNASGETILTGSPTEVSLRLFATTNMSPESFETIDRLPFDTRWKYAATVVKKGSTTSVIAIGAPEAVIAASSLTSDEKKAFERAIQEMTEEGLRVIGVAVRDGDVPHELRPELISGLRVAALIGLRDPVRESVIPAMEEARQAHLRPIMITGDHPQTAQAIAKKVGILKKGDRVMTGEELDDISDQELIRIVKNVSVYARVLPKHKLRIVKAWQALGVSVAMTGDGVNDAPAIKAADIGIALGSGTAVARETADMVLLDNNFATIIAAIREGRIIFDNVRKVLAYLLAGTFSETVLVAGALFFGLPLPLLPVHILWINLVTDGFPSIALTFEPGEKGVMSDPPRKKSDPLLDRELKILIFIIGLSTDLILFALFFYLLGQGYSIEHIRTFIFAKLGIGSLVYIFAIRTFRQSVFRSNPFSNPYLIVGVGIGLVFQFIPLIVIPIREAFGFSVLAPADWMLVIGLAFLNLLMIEYSKFFANRRRKRGDFSQPVKNGIMALKA